MRTPSMSKAITTPRKRIHPASGRVCGTMYAATVRTTTTISLPNMEIPLVCPSLLAAVASAPARSGGAFRGDLERVATGVDYVECAAGLQGLAALDSRVPAGPAVAHPRQARRRIDPLLEARRH